MIQITELRKSYHGIEVLHVPELYMKRGESVGLVGNNGAGKTTLLSLLLDLIQPDGGTMILDQVPVSGNDQWKQFTCAFIDESFLIGYLTAWEYFYLLGQFRGVGAGQVEEVVAQYDEFLPAATLEQPVFIRDLSKGNQRKVCIIAALIGAPDLVVLDEPFANLDPSSQHQLKRLINTLREQQNTTFLISSHDLSHTVEISDRIIALRAGRIEKDLYTNPETLEELSDFFHQQ